MCYIWHIWLPKSSISKIGYHLAICYNQFCSANFQTAVTQCASCCIIMSLYWLPQYIVEQPYQAINIRGYLFIWQMAELELAQLALADDPFKWIRTTWQWANTDIMQTQTCNTWLIGTGFRDDCMLKNVWQEKVQKLLLKDYVWYCNMRNQPLQTSQEHKDTLFLMYLHLLQPWAWTLNSCKSHLTNSWVTSDGI